ncbi:MAG TPA: hypothetical protein VHF86_00395, partial [Xanthomonadaceae bacterium]|nr:hypothetical protein [Xanthomonadaceae bacterium]
MNAPDLRDALARSTLLHDRAALEAQIVRMAGEIAADLGGADLGGADLGGMDLDGDDAQEPSGGVPLFVTVMHGGLPFAAQLAFALGERGLDLEFDYLHATRYRGQTSGSGLAWL